MKRVVPNVQIDRRRYEVLKLPDTSLRSSKSVRRVWQRRMCDNAMEKLEIEQNIRRVRRVPLDGVLVAKVCWWPHRQQRNTWNTWNVWPPSHRTCSNCVWKGEPVRCMRVHWCCIDVLNHISFVHFLNEPGHHICVLLSFLWEYSVPRVCELYASYRVLFRPGPLRWPWTSSTSSRSWELCQALWAEGQSGKIIKCHEMSRFFCWKRTFWTENLSWNSNLNAIELNCWVSGRWCKLETLLVVILYGSSGNTVTPCDSPFDGSMVLLEVVWT